MIYRLNNGEWEPSPLRKKEIYYPKFRTAQVPGLEDKIIQHVIYDGYAYFCLSKPMVKECSANLRGRGDSYAIDHLKEQLHKYYRKHQRPPYILKCDIHNFFGSIKHKRAKDIIGRYIDDEDVLKIMYKFTDMTDDGLPLGLMQNQQIANLFLSEMDHILKEHFHCKYYGRHMDDFWILGEKEELEKLLEWITCYVESIGLTLNPKTGITYRSFDFLGFTFIVTDSGKVVQRLQNGKRKTKLKHLKQQVKQLQDWSITVEHLQYSYNSWREHASHGNTRNMLINMDKRLDEMLRPLGYHLVPVKTHSKAAWRKNKQIRKRVEIKIVKTDT